MPNDNGVRQWEIDNFRYFVDFTEATLSKKRKQLVAVTKDRPCRSISFRVWLAITRTREGGKRDDIGR